MKHSFSLVDLGITATGIGVAALSVAFAVNAVGNADRPKEIAGSEHLLIFTRPVSKPIALARRPSPDEQEIEADPLPTGSLRPAKATPPGAPAALSGGLRLVQPLGDRALLTGPEGPFIATPGERLADGAIVLGIEQVAGRWQLRTSRGTLALGN